MTDEVALFYHTWAPRESNIWKFIIDEQVKRIFRSGLSNRADIYCCINGAEHLHASEFLSTYDWINIIDSTKDESEYEGLTLKHLHDLASAGKYSKVGYIHTKGIRLMDNYSTKHSDFRSVNSWRHSMEMVVIDKWQDVLNKLDIYDVVGAHYRDRPWPHFSGNFWWATANYIQRLPRPTGADYPTSQDFDGHSLALKERTKFERWIGVGSPFVYDFYNRDIKVHGRKIKAAHELTLHAEDIALFVSDNLR